jgi:hypothetical protein
MGGKHENGPQENRAEGRGLEASISGKKLEFGFAEHSKLSGFTKDEDR